MTDRDKSTNRPRDAALPAVFTFEATAVRTVVADNNAVWFVAADVCEVLAHTNTSQALLRLDDDEKASVLIESDDGARETNIVSESGLYHLVMSSRKPHAKSFRRWVTGEVLAAVRRTGRYDAGHPAGQWDQTGLRDRVLLVLRGWGQYTALVEADTGHRNGRMSFNSLVEDFDRITFERVCLHIRGAYLSWMQRKVINLVCEPGQLSALEPFESALKEAAEFATRALRGCIARAYEVAEDVVPPSKQRPSTPEDSGQATPGPGAIDSGGTGGADDRAGGRASTRAKPRRRRKAQDDERGSARPR